MGTSETQPFYREVQVDDLGLAARRFFTTTFGLRCPACERSNVTKGLFGVKERCPECGSRFDRMEGNELISIPLSFFLACIVLLATALVLIPRYGFFDGLMAVLAAVGVVFVLLTVRPMRVITLWMLWLLGFVYPDRMTEKGKRVLPVRPADEARAAEARGTTDAEAAPPHAAPGAADRGPRA